MKTKLTIVLLLSIVLSAKAQIDSTFWNPQMLQLAETNSTNGWIKIQPKIHYSSQTFFTNNKEAFGLTVDDAMEYSSNYTDELGLVHYKFQHHYKGIQVENCEYILHENNGNIISANGDIACNLNQQTTPNVNETAALNFALQDMNATKYGWEVVKNEDEELLSQYPIGELLLAHLNNNGDFSNSNYRLAYRFSITTVEPFFSKQAIYVDAINGNIIKKQNLILDGHCDCCQGTTITLYHGFQYITTKHNGFPFYNYVLLDNCRGDGIQAYYNGNKVRDPNNNFVNNHKDKVGASAHWAAEMTYDYFLNNHNRNSFDNNGSKINLYTGEGEDNAYWDGSDLYFGKAGTLTSNDLVSIDVVGHEFTHAVTQHSANLVYSYESGALNESFSDIFGTMIEYYGLNGSGDYLIGEDFWIADGKLRDMQNPNSKNHPDTYGGTNWWTSSGDNGGVHVNSGVQNFWFYLLSEGGSGVNDLGNNYNVQGISRNKAAAIAYRNLTVYLTSSSDYSDAKNGAIWSAMDLYGTCSNEVLQTIRAWDAVGVSSIGGIDYNVFVDCSLLNFIHNQGSPYTARAINNLESDCDISSSSNAQVTFVAGNSITLKSGFSSGSNFHAFIDPCFSGIQLKMADNSDNDTPQYIIERPTKIDSNINSKTVTNEVSKSKFEISPNPSKGKISIIINEMDFDNAEIHVHDTGGKLILTRTISNQKTTIDLTKQQKGVYFINLIQDNKIYSKKVILN